jgi:hypothetical protein
MATIAAPAKPHKGPPMEGFLATWYARNTSKTTVFALLADRLVAHLSAGPRVLEVAPNLAISQSNWPGAVFRSAAWTSVAHSFASPREGAARAVSGALGEIWRALAPGGSVRTCGGCSHAIQRRGPARGNWLRTVAAQAGLTSGRVSLKPSASNMSASDRETSPWRALPVPAPKRSPRVPDRRPSLAPSVAGRR